MFYKILNRLTMTVTCTIYMREGVSIHWKDYWICNAQNQGETLVVVCSIIIARILIIFEFMCVMTSCPNPLVCEHTERNLIYAITNRHLCTMSICDRACENRACGHKLHPIALQVISLYWKRIFPFCNLHHDAT